MFYCVPIWFGLYLNIWSSLGLGFNFTAGFKASSLGFILLLAVFVPFSLLQLLVYYRSGHLKTGLLKVALLVIAVLVIALSSMHFASLYIHHWEVGLLGFLFFQGQPKSRYSIVLQAVMLGVFVS